MESANLHFTLIDQYHSGLAEVYHHREKYGNLPSLRFGP